MVREISILLSVVDDGIAINLSRGIGEKGAFLSFLHELLEKGGFDADPRTVNFERNKLTPEGYKINWFRLRIPAEECRTHFVHAPTVACKMARCLRSREFQRRHRLAINLTTKGFDESDCLRGNGHGQGKQFSREEEERPPQKIHYARVDDEGDLL